MQQFRLAVAGDVATRYELAISFVTGVPRDSFSRSNLVSARIGVLVAATGVAVEYSCWKEFIQLVEDSIFAVVI